MKRLFIVGGGMGEKSLLTLKAAGALSECGEILALDRLSELFRDSFKAVTKTSYSDLADSVLNATCETVGVLLSGDVGFFSAAQGLINKLSGLCEIRLFPGISSLQYLSSRLLIPYQDIKVVSLHGREGCALGSIAYNEYTFVLTGGENPHRELLRELLDTGIEGITVTAAERLSMPDERIVTGAVSELVLLEFSAPLVLLFKNVSPQNRHKTLFDSAFTRGKTPMTKEAVRWVITSIMDTEPADTVYDIGAGTGSVAIELARRAYNGRVFAVERDREALALIKENVKRLSAANVRVVSGSAVEAIAPLPPPDRVFIGGSGGDLEAIVRAVLEKNSGARLVVSAITLETLGRAVELFKDLKLTYGVTLLNSAFSKSAGEYNLLTANNPVFIIWGERCKTLT